MADVRKELQKQHSLVKEAEIRAKMTTKAAEEAESAHKVSPKLFETLRSKLSVCSLRIRASECPWRHRLLFRFVSARFSPSSFVTSACAVVSSFRNVQKYNLFVKDHGFFCLGKAV